MLIFLKQLKEAVEAFVRSCDNPDTVALQNIPHKSYENI